MSAAAFLDPWNMHEELTIKITQTQQEGETRSTSPLRDTHSRQIYPEWLFTHLEVFSIGPYWNENIKKRRWPPGESRTSARGCFRSLSENPNGVLLDYVIIFCNDLLIYTVYVGSSFPTGYTTLWHRRTPQGPWSVSDLCGAAIRTSTELHTDPWMSKGFVRTASRYAYMLFTSSVPSPPLSYPFDLFQPVEVCARVRVHVCVRGCVCESVMWVWAEESVEIYLLIYWSPSNINL